MEENKQKEWEQSIGEIVLMIVEVIPSHVENKGFSPKIDYAILIEGTTKYPFFNAKRGYKKVNVRGSFATNFLNTHRFYLFRFALWSLIGRFVFKR